MAEGKYSALLADLAAQVAELPEMVKVIEKSIKQGSKKPEAPVKLPRPKIDLDAINATLQEDLHKFKELERLGKISLDTDITKFLLQKTRPSKDEQIELFKQEFKKAYGLSDENYGRMSALVSESYKKNPDFMFDAHGGLKADAVESLILLAYDLKEKKELKFEPFVDRLPEHYKGIKTLGDLITQYSSLAKSSEDALRRMDEMRKKMQGLEARVDAQDKKVRANTNDAELEMHKILEAMDKYSQKISPVVRIDFYNAYLNLEPQNETLKGIVLYNVGCAYMNDLQKDETALSYFKKALEISKKEYAANPGSPDAERRRVKYQCGLEACEENIRKAKKVLLPA